ncbi:MAG: ISAs1 family transposase [Planctomycetia bacterium]|nr:ISAs1 family transposase [Planctomycetia bacterium]
MADTVRMDVKEILRHFEQLEDPRSEVNRLHPLDSVVVIAIMAVLAGANGPTAIAKWANIKSKILLNLLRLPHGIPQKDVFRRVLATLKPDVFQACFTMWLTALRAAAAEATGVERPTLAIDGKTVRRSHDRRRNLGALHSVTVWASEFGLTLAQVATAEKSNEITAIPTLLSLVDIHGAIITIDAMGTQTAIAEQIIDGKGDYILALKGNQGSLHEAAIAHIAEQTKTDFQGIGARRLDTTETKHGRTEMRTYIQMPAPKSLPGFDRWKGLLSIGVAILCCIREGKQTLEARYFISSLPVKVKQFAHAVRSHWGIENSCHWCLDVTYREDESRIRDEHLRENFAWLNRLTLSLLKQHSSKDSVAMKRRACGWNDDYMLQVLTGTSR